MVPGSIPGLCIPEIWVRDKCFLVVLQYIITPAVLFAPFSLSLQEAGFFFAVAAALSNPSKESGAKWWVLTIFMRYQTQHTMIWVHSELCGSGPDSFPPNKKAGYVRLAKKA